MSAEAGLPMLPDLPDGIYFDLPEAVYHAIPRLSTSGIQHLRISAATFWAGSWLNRKKAVALASASLAALADLGESDGPPDYLAGLAEATKAAFPAAADAVSDEKATKAQQLGKAYHCARLEPDQLEHRFCRKPDRADYPAGTLFTGTDIERTLADLGEAKKKAGETVLEQAQRLAAHLGDDAPAIFPLEMDRWETARGKRIGISAEYWDDLIEDMERLRSSPVAQRLLTGGIAEVSLLWTDGRGIRMKCRIDYLTAEHWADLKTFDNTVGKELEQKINETFRYNRHHIQGGVYRDGVELLRADALPIRSPSNEHQRQIVGRLATAPAEAECWFVYQEKNGVPNILGRRMEFFDVPQNVRMQHAGASEEGIAAVEAATRTSTFIYRKATEEIGAAKADFLNYSEIYEPGRPWHPWSPMRTFDDLDFPDRWLRNE